MDIGKFLFRAPLRTVVVSTLVHIKWVARLLINWWNGRSMKQIIPFHIMFRSFASKPQHVFIWSQFHCLSPWATMLGWSVISWAELSWVTLQLTVSPSWNWDPVGHMTKL